MEKFLKALWGLFMDYSEGANERAIKRHNEDVESFYDSMAAGKQMSYSQAEAWKDCCKR